MLFPHIPLFLILFATSAAAQTPVLSVPSYKGIDYGWGSNTFGTPTYERWLADSYDSAAIKRDLDAMAGVSTITTTAWLFLDRCIVKNSDWGTPTYRPSFYPDCVANWEDFLRQLRAHHMAAIVNLLNRGGAIGTPAASIERAALPPQALDSALLGPGIANGDMAVAAGGFPVGWYSEGPGQAILSGPGNGLSASGWSLNLVAGPDAVQSVRTPVVSFDGTSLAAITVPVKGNVLQISVLYYGGDGSLLSTDDWPVAKDFGGTWYSLRLGTLDPGVLPRGTASIAVRITVPAGASGVVGPVSIGNGERNGIWQNYQSAIQAWVTRYSGATDSGKAIIGWQAIDEGYTGVSWGDGWGSISPAFLHGFYLDVYRTIRGVPSAQPVGVESSATAFPVWAQDASGKLSNLNFYKDVADYYNLHLFDDSGSIPPSVGSFDKPWLIGEAGASASGSPPHFSDPSQPYEPNAISAFLANAAPAGALAVLPWTYNTNPNLIYIDKTKAIVGSAGEFIKDFRSDAHRNAASYSTAIAPGSLVTAFGDTRSSGTAQSASLPLPETLAGLTVNVTDANGIGRRTPLVYASPKQVIYEMPRGTAPGWALATMTGADGSIGTSLFVVTNVAPGIFSADGSGSGPAAAVVVRYEGNAYLSYAYTSAIDSKTNAPVNSPIDLADPAQTVVLELYGVGVRNYNSSVELQVSPGNITLPVQYAGPAPGFPGLDQINILLPQSLAGAGPLSAQLLVDGIVSNAVQIAFK